LANQYRGGFDELIYCYLRYTDNQRVLVVVNFDRAQRQLHIILPDDLLNQLNLNSEKELTDMLTGDKYYTDNIRAGLAVTLPSASGVLLNF